MLKRLIAATPLLLLALPAAANPIGDADRWAIDLGGSASYLHLPTFHGVTFKNSILAGTGPIDEVDDEGVGAGFTLGVGGGLGDLFAIGRPVSLRVEFGWTWLHTQDSVTLAPGATAGVGALDGSSYLSSASPTVSAAQSGELNSNLYELAVLLGLPYALGDGLVLRPFGGLSFMSLHNDAQTSYQQAAISGQTQETWDTSYYGGKLGAALEFQDGAWRFGASAALGLYASKSSYSGHDGLGGPVEDKSSDFAWQGQGELKLGYDFGPATLSLNAGGRYLSSTAQVERPYSGFGSVIPVVNQPSHLGADSAWGAFAGLTLSVPF